MVIVLSSAICPQVDEADLDSYAGFLVEVAGSCQLVGGAGCGPSGGQGHVKSCVYQAAGWSGKLQVV